MLFSTLISSAALPLLAMASPINPRAGAPLYTPIPANCTLVDPLPHASDNCGNATVNGWKPTDAFMNKTAYSYYLSQPDFEAYNTRYEGCLEQCNYLSNCKSVLFGNNIPTPAGYYGTAGGVLSLGCIMFQDFLTPNDFVATTEGTWVNETAANIYCPS